MASVGHCYAVVISGVRLGDAGSKPLWLIVFVPKAIG
jgi:hypothetical protein